MFIHLNKTKASLVFTFILLIIVSKHLQATEVQFSGFTNVGLTYSDSDVLGYRSSLQNDGYQDLSFQPDSLLGLQANFKFSPKFDAVTQVVLQDRDNKDIENYIELAFLRYQANRNWIVKVGRFSTNSYLYTDYRYVGHLLTWVRPPLEMYSAAGSLGNMDGINLSYTMDVNWGAIKFSGAYGQANFKDGNDEEELSVDYTKLTSLNIELQATDWRFHLAYLTAITDNIESEELAPLRNIDQIVPSFFVPFARELQHNMIPDGRRIRYLSAGGHYSFEGVELTAELADYDSDWVLADGARSGYITLAYPAQEFTPFATLAFYHRKREPDVIDFDNARNLLPPIAFQQLQLLTSGSNTAARGTSVDQESLSVGLRWDFSPRWSVKGQFDYFQINEFGAGFFSVEDDSLTPAGKTSYRVYSINFTTTF